MVVEDEPNIGALVRTYLARDGYEVLWVRSGEDALAELPRHAVTLVVLDIGLPGIDGFEVCRRVRADPATAFLPVDHDDRQECGGRIGPDAAADLESVDSRHHDVEQDQVRLMLGQRLQGFLTRAGRAHLVSPVHEVRFE